MLKPDDADSLSLRGTSGERAGERGVFAPTGGQRTPPLPNPLLHPMEERE
jgi:hypothetical protein